MPSIGTDDQYFFVASTQAFLNVLKLPIFSRGDGYFHRDFPLTA